MDVEASGPLPHQLGHLSILHRLRDDSLGQILQPDYDPSVGRSSPLAVTSASMGAARGRTVAMAAMMAMLAPEGLRRLPRPALTAVLVLLVGPVVVAGVGGARPDEEDLVPVAAALKLVIDVVIIVDDVVVVVVAKLAIVITGLGRAPVQVELVPPEVATPWAVGTGPAGASQSDQGRRAQQELLVRTLD